MQQVVAPHVGFCVKSWVESHADSHNSNRQVVYLNLLFHKDVPEAVARPIVVASAHDERCATGHCSHDDSSWEIAYVLGPPRSHRAKDGTLRSVYDFIFGVKTLHRAQSDEQFRLVLVQSCYRALAEKFNITLSKQFQLVKKYAFKAPPERPKSMVTEMASAEDTGPTRTSAATVAADYTISRAQEAGILKYHVRIMLPKLDTAAGSSLALTRHTVSFSAPGKYHANIDLGAHVAIDIEGGYESVFDQISRVLHVHFRANETQHNKVSPPEAVVPSHKLHEHHHHHSHTAPADDHHFTRAFAGAPPFPPQVLDLKSSSPAGDGTRYVCFCRQTLRTITLVLAVDGEGVSLATKVSATGLQLQIELSVSASREHTLDIALFRAVKPSPVTASVSRATVVLVLEKVDPAFWPSLAPPPAARTSSALRF